WFFAYGVFAVAAGMARFVVRNHQSAYFATYWITEAAYDVLGILVMYEVSRAVLGNLIRAWWARLLFPAVVTIGIGLTMARMYAVPPQVEGLLFWIVAGEISVRFVQVLIFA